MGKRFAVLDRIENSRPITKETDDTFLFQMQSGLLLTLKERGRLSEMQYRHAQEKLNRQRREWMKKSGGKHD